MPPKKEVLKNSKLYLIVSPHNARALSLESIVERAIAGGVDIVQLRCKDISEQEYLRLAKPLRQITHSRGKLFVINDNPHVALESGADAVHIGQDDMSVEKARAIVGKDVLIGKSTHSFEQAMAAQEEDVDYLGFGPIYSTPTKPDYVSIGLSALEQIRGRIKKPFFAIGGIDTSNAGEVLSRGASRLAVVRAIAEAGDPTQASKAFCEILEHFKNSNPVIGAKA